MTIRVVLADDHRMVREALREVLLKVPDIEVVGEAGTGAEALEVTGRLRPDVLVLDISLPDINGIEVASRLVGGGTTAKLVALSQHADKRYVTAIVRAGAHAYVTKSAAGTELVLAIRAVAAGHGYFAPEIAGALADEMRGEPPGADPAPPAPQLAPREREVLCLIAEGARTAAIAERLQVSAATIDVHRRNIMRKLGLRTVAELTRFAIREGLVNP
ncbi:MAG: response regulator transcription factor [Proteobacteria bacterium]|nr:response regulator transcription factor [Pseudomonadota bacterium]